MFYPSMRTLRIFQSTRHPAKFIKALTVVKKTENKAVGVSKGGRNTKIHALTDATGRPLAFLLSPGNDYDSIHAIPLLSKVNIKGSNILGDKAFGAKSIRDYITSQGATYTIPPMRHIKNPWDVDRIRYKKRNVVERFFQKIKWFRRIATRYEKLDSSFLAFVYIASISVLLHLHNL